MYKMYTNPLCCLLTWSDALDTIQCISFLPEGVSKIVEDIYNKPKYFKMNGEALLNITTSIMRKQNKIYRCITRIHLLSNQPLESVVSNLMSFEEKTLFGTLRSIYLKYVHIMT